MVIIAFFKLIRLPILLLIVAIQYAMRYCILEPMFSINNFEFIISDGVFALLVLGGTLLAAGGYAINDYFDTKIDRINKPQRVVVDRLITRRIAMATHIVLSVIGLGLTSFISWRLGVWQLSALYLFAFVCLWFYSTNFQHQLIFGNVVIATMAAMVPMVVGLYEIPLQNQAHVDLIQQLGYSIFNVPAYWIIGYAVLLFLLTLIREITKDVVDMKGDKLYGARTLPIVFGVPKTKSVLITLYTLLAALCSYYYFSYISEHHLLIPVLSLLLIGIVMQFILIFRARTKKEFKRSSNLNNLFTILLLISAVLIRFSIENHFQ